MTLTSKTAVKVWKSIKCAECKESIETFPEAERDGKTDEEIVKGEIEYFIELFEEEGTTLNGDLEEARVIIRETKNGKANKAVILPGGRIKPKWSEWDIQRARNTVGEYNQLKRLAAKL